MTNEAIFYTQIFSIIGYIVIVFFLYHLFFRKLLATIKQKDETIEHLKMKLFDAEKKSPDVLIHTLSKRVKTVTEELELANKEKDKLIEKQKENYDIELEKRIKNLITKITRLQEEAGKSNFLIERLNTDLKVAQDIVEEFTCSNCGALQTIRFYHPDTVIINGEEIDFEREVIEFECGLRLEAAKETVPCSRRKAAPSA